MGAVTGPQGVTRVSRVEVSAPAILRQDIAGDWSHLSVTVSFIWSANGVDELTRAITVTLDEANGKFNVPSPVTGITATYDANQYTMLLKSTYNNVSDYIQLGLVRMADPVLSASTFTPTWGAGNFTGGDPSGVVAYSTAQGIVSLLLTAARTATSNSTTMTWQAGSLPAALRPAADRAVQCRLRYNNTLYTFGAVTLKADGSAVFAVYNGVTGALDPAGFLASEAKGLPADWCAVFPL